MADKKEIKADERKLAPNLVEKYTKLAPILIINSVKLTPNLVHCVFLFYCCIPSSCPHPASKSHLLFPVLRSECLLLRDFLKYVPMNVQKVQQPAVQMYV